MSNTIFGHIFAAIRSKQKDQMILAFHVITSGHIGKSRITCEPYNNNNNYYYYTPLPVETYGNCRGEVAQGTFSRLATHLAISQSMPKALMVVDIYGR